MYTAVFYKKLWFPRCWGGERSKMGFIFLQKEDIIVLHVCTKFQVHEKKFFLRYGVKRGQKCGFSAFSPKEA